MKILESKEVLPLHEYRFIEPGSVVFLTGTPLSGKSTIAPIVSMQIENCAMQHMDVIRLLSQQIELIKPEGQRNNLVMFGSTDAYTQIGDGTYSDAALIEGYKQYSKAVTKHFFAVLNQLNPEDISNMFIEGVQLLPEIVAPYLQSHPGLLIILTSNNNTLQTRVEERYIDPTVQSKYRPKMLQLIQDTLLDQSKIISQKNLLVIKNNLEPLNTANAIIKSLIKKRVLLPR